MNYVITTNFVADDANGNSVILKKYQRVNISIENGKVKLINNGNEYFVLVDRFIRINATTTEEFFLKTLDKVFGNYDDLDGRHLKSLYESNIKVFDYKDANEFLKCFQFTLGDVYKSDDQDYYYLALAPASNSCMASRFLLKIRYDEIDEFLYFCTNKEDRKCIDTEIDALYKLYKKTGRNIDKLLKNAKTNKYVAGIFNSENNVTIYFVNGIRFNLEP